MIFIPTERLGSPAYTTGVHFESRLAHVHGNLFGLLNVGLGFLLLRLDEAPARALQTVSVLGLVLSVAVSGVLALRYWPRAR